MRMYLPARRGSVALAAAIATLLALANPAAATPTATDGEFTDGTLTVSGGNLPEPIAVDLGSDTPLDPCSNDSPVDSVATVNVDDPVSGVYGTTVTGFTGKSFFEADFDGSGTETYRLDSTLWVDPFSPPNQSGSISGSDPYTVSQNVGLEATITKLSISNGSCSDTMTSCTVFIQAALAGSYDQDTGGAALPALDGVATLNGGGTVATGACDSPIDNIDTATATVSGLEVLFPPAP